MEVRAHPSPNFGERRGGVTPDLIVLHYTAMASAPEALARLCLPEHEVSAHYLICEQGHTHQLVDEGSRAWHAGAGAWGGCSDINSRSIGIELANDGTTPFSAAQMDALEALVAGVMQRWSIPPERVIGHSDMAPLRKVDPGSRFDWRRMALQGLSVWPMNGAAQTPEMDGFIQMANRFGYPETDEPETILAAFRLRFSPGTSGPLCAADMAQIFDLAARFPVDQSVPSA